MYLVAANNIAQDCLKTINSTELPIGPKLKKSFITHKRPNMPENCKSHTDSTEYLGYILFPNGLSTFEDKVKLIQD